MPAIHQSANVMAAASPSIRSGGKRQPFLSSSICSATTIESLQHFVPAPLFSPVLLRLVVFTARRQLLDCYPLTFVAASERHDDRQSAFTNYTLRHLSPCCMAGTMRSPLLPRQASSIVIFCPAQQGFESSNKVTPYNATIDGRSSLSPPDKSSHQLHRQHSVGVHLHDSRCSFENYGHYQ